VIAVRVEVSIDTEPRFVLAWGDGVMGRDSGTRHRDPSVQRCQEFCGGEGCEL